MSGKTSLFTILTGVHQETRIGSTAARMGVAKVPDARLDELARLFEPPKVTHATVEYVDMPSISQGEPARPQLPGQPARGGRLRARAAPVRGRDRPPRKGLGRPAARPGGRGDRTDPERPGGGRKAPRAPGQGPQEDQESGARPRIRVAGQVQGRARGRISRCASSNSTPRTRSAFAASSSSRRSRCSTS